MKSAVSVVFLFFLLLYFQLVFLIPINLKLFYTLLVSAAGESLWRTATRGYNFRRGNSGFSNSSVYQCRNIRTVAAKVVLTPAHIPPFLDHSKVPSFLQPIFWGSENVRESNRRKHDSRKVNEGWKWKESGCGCHDILLITRTTEGTRRLWGSNVCEASWTCELEGVGFVMRGWSASGAWSLEKEIRNERKKKGHDGGSKLPNVTGNRNVKKSTVMFLSLCHS